MTSAVILLLLLILIFYVLRPRRQIKRCRREESPAVGSNTLNDMESPCNRIATYDDTARISNKLFWSSDYSHPEYDSQRSLNDDIITPIRPVSGHDAINYFSNMHQMSRFGGCGR